VTRFTHDFKSQTAGTTVTVVNSDDFGDSPLTAVVVAAGSTLTYETAELASGYPSVRSAFPVTAAATYFAKALTQWPVAYGRMLVRINQNPSAALGLIFGTTITGGTVNQCRVSITAAGKLAISNLSTIQATSTDSVPLNTPFVIEWMFSMSATSTGSMTASFHAAGVAATANQQIASSTSQNWSLAYLEQFRVVQPASGGPVSPLVVEVGAVAFDDTTAPGDIVTAQYHRPASDVTITGWTSSSGVGSLASHIDDDPVNDTDYVTSVAV